MLTDVRAPQHLTVSAPPADLGLCPERVRRLMDTLNAEVAQGRLPGGVVMLARHGKTALLESFGVQDPARGVPMRKDAIFRIYSMTKPIVSVATMMLLEQGKLLLTDPVSKYIPAFAKLRVSKAGAVDTGDKGDKDALSAPAKAPTIQDLLRHTAGLTYEFLGNADVQRHYAQVRINQRGRTNAEFCDVLAGIPLMFEPGRVWEYSRATDVLGRVVEVVSGQSLGEYLRQHILEPLGMLDTAFSVPSAKHERIAEPFAHDPDGGVRMAVFDPRETPAMEAGGGGLLSTAPDYARFLQFMLNKGELDGVRLLGPRTVDYMTADHLGNTPINPNPNGDLLPPGHGFGLGFAVRTAAGLAAVPGSVGLYYWSGIAGTTFFVDPAEDLYAMLLIQAPNQREYYRLQFRTMVYACLVD